MSWKVTTYQPYYILLHPPTHQPQWPDTVTSHSLKCMKTYQSHWLHFNTATLPPLETESSRRGIVLKYHLPRSLLYTASAILYRDNQNALQKTFSSSLHSLLSSSWELKRSPRASSIPSTQQRWVSLLRVTTPHRYKTSHSIPSPLQNTTQTKLLVNWENLENENGVFPRPSEWIHHRVHAPVSLNKPPQKNDLSMIISIQWRPSKQNLHSSVG